jgi:protein-tyrosine phosphatase
MYSNDPRFEVKSAGTHAFSHRQVSAKLVKWADLIVVMEEEHARRIRGALPDALGETPIIVLGIPDIYEYMEQALQREIRTRFEAAVGQS